MWPAINMGRYHFYNEFPNDYCFQDEDSGLSTDESYFDQYNFYYDWEELQKPADPSMMDETMISFVTSSSHQHHKGGVTFSIILLPNVMMKCPLPTQPDLIAYATDLEAELNCMIHTI
jgi:hypothetical protein